MLIVEDDRSLVDILTQALNEEGYFTMDSSNRADTVAMMGTVQYDVMLVDLHMPEMSGVEVIAMMKQLAITAPVVLMSGDPRLTLHVPPTSQGVYFLEKPFSLDQLFSIVGAHIKQPYQVP